jgi:hypothetical protein
MPTSRSRGLGPGLIAMAGGLAINSILGPLVLNVVTYPVTPTMLNQTLGLDAASLLLVAPLSVATGILAFRRHPAASALALGPACYTPYMFVQYIVGPSYLYFPTTLTLHLALFLLGWVNSVAAWTSVTLPTPERDRGRDQKLGVLLLLLSGFILLRYLPALAGSMRQTPLPLEALGDPAMFWTIFLLDVGIVVPLALSAGIDLLGKGSVWAWKTGLATIGWFALVSTSVAAMGAVMLIRGDRYATGGTTVAFAAMALFGIASAAWVYRPFLHPSTRLDRF